MWMRQRTFSTVLKIVVSVGLIIWLLARIGAQQIAGQIATANLWWILAAIAVFSLSNVLGSLQWYLLLRSKDLSLSFTRVLGFYHVGLFFNNFLIGNVGGDAFRIYDVSKETGDTTNAVSTVFFDRFVGFFTLTFIAMIVSLLWIQQLASMKTVYTIAIVLAGWLFGILFLFFESVAKRTSTWIARLLPRVVNDKLRDMYFELNRFRHNKRLLISVLAVSFLVQLLRVLTHVLAARSVGVDNRIYYFFVFIPIIAMAASLPISLGGIGVREQSSVALFARIGVAANLVVAFEFIAYLVGIIASLPGGVVFVLRKSAAREELKSVRAMRESAPKTKPNP